MPFVNLSEVVNDPDLGETFVILRTKGSFGLGGWIAEVPQQVPAYGVVQPADDEALAQVPEGDRVEGAMQIYCQQPIYETLAKESGISDKVRWHGSTYRVSRRSRWEEFGYYGALLTRIEGE